MADGSGSGSGSVRVRVNVRVNVEMKFGTTGGDRMVRGERITNSE